MIWPAPIATFHVHLLPVTASEKVQETTQFLYQSLTEAGVEVLWDDRDERAGVKFNDADLIRDPYHVTIGGRGLAKGIIESNIHEPEKWPKSSLSTSPRI